MLKCYGVSDPGRALVLWSLLMAFAVGAAAAPPPADLVADKYGTGNHTTIQAAVNAAAPGNVIWVLGAEYQEQVNLGGKSLQLHGIDWPVINPGSGVGVDLSGCDANTVLSGFVVKGANTGVYGQASYAQVIGNRVVDNSQSGIVFEANWPLGLAGRGSPVISGNLIARNTTWGMWLSGAHPTANIVAEHNVVLGCGTPSTAAVRAGHADETMASTGIMLLNNLLAQNTGWALMSAGDYAAVHGSYNTLVDNPVGGIRTIDGSDIITLWDCILWNGSNDVYGLGTHSLANCDIQDGDFEGQNGNFSADPLYVAIPGSLPYYLSQTFIPGGQMVDSPCFNRGGQFAVSVGLQSRTTRTDEAGDTGVADLGYHFVAGGPFAAPTVARGPTPANQATGIFEPVDASWFSTDPDGLPAMWDVWLGTTNPPQTKVASNLTTPATTFTSLAPLTTYYWRVFTRDQDGATTPGPVWRFTTITPPPSIVRDFPAGLQFVGIPMAPDEPDAQELFGHGGVSWYDPAIPGYVSHPDARTDVAPAKGLWVLFPAATQLTIYGQPVDPGAPFAASILRGWNGVAPPYDAAVPFGGLTTGAEGALSPFGYVWNGSDYTLLTALPGFPGSVSAVQSFQACWAFCTVDATTLVFPAAGGAGVAEAGPAGEASGWAARLIAETSTATDGASYFGVGAQACALPKPPAAGGPVRLVFERDGDPDLGLDLKPEGAPLNWNVRVEATPGEEVSVRWPDLSQLPRDLIATLVDSVAGRRVSLRTSHNYALRMGRDGARRLQLEVRRRRAGETLALTGAVAQAAGGAGATIEFVASRAARVDVTVVNVAGRTVRRLAGERDVGAGPTSLAWDLCNDAGTRLPNGRYLIRITARTEDGQQASAVTSLAVGR